MTPSTLRRAVAAAALAGAAGAAAAAPVVVAVGDMSAAQWAQIVLRDEGAASVGFAVATPVGQPSNTVWLTSFSHPASTRPTTSADIVANVFTAYAYDPAAEGAIDRLDVSFDARGVFSSFASGVTGFVRPLVEQGGVVYTVLGSSQAVVSGTGFTTLSWQLEDDADWRALVGGGRPDFSAAGSPLHLGYRWDLGTTCTGARGCFAAGSNTFVDNLRVEITAQAAAVSEPAPLALLLGGGVVAVALARRQVKTVSTPV